MCARGSRVLNPSKDTSAVQPARLIKGVFALHLAGSVLRLVAPFRSRNSNELASPSSAMDLRFLLPDKSTFSMVCIGRKPNFFSPVCGAKTCVRFSRFSSPDNDSRL